MGADVGDFQVADARRYGWLRSFDPIFYRGKAQQSSLENGGCKIADISPEH